MGRLGKCTVLESSKGSLFLLRIFETLYLVLHTSFYLLNTSKFTQAADGGGVQKSKPALLNKSTSLTPRSLDIAIPLTGRPDPAKLRLIVKEFGEFPVKYRYYDCACI